MDPRLRGDDSGRSSVGDGEGASLFPSSMVDDTGRGHLAVPFQHG